MHSVSAEQVGWTEGLPLARPSLEMRIRLAVAEARHRGVHTPGYSTVRSVAQGLDPALVSLALEGPAAYRDRHEPVLRQRADRTNTIWRADRTQLDILNQQPGWMTMRT